MFQELLGRAAEAVCLLVCLYVCLSVTNLCCPCIDTTCSECQFYKCLAQTKFFVNAYACKIWIFGLPKNGAKLRQTYENGYPRSLKLNGMIL